MNSGSGNSPPIGSVLGNAMINAELANAHPTQGPAGAPPAAGSSAASPFSPPARTIFGSLGGTTPANPTPVTTVLGAGRQDKLG
jgi:hypothetical protein